MAKNKNNDSFDNDSLNREEEASVPAAGQITENDDLERELLALFEPSDLEEADTTDNASAQSADVDLSEASDFVISESEDFALSGSLDNHDNVEESIIVSFTDDGNELEGENLSAFDFLSDDEAAALFTDVIEEEQGSGSLAENDGDEYVSVAVEDTEEELIKVITRDEHIPENTAKAEKVKNFEKAAKVEKDIKSNKKSKVERDKNSEKAPKVEKTKAPEVPKTSDKGETHGEGSPLYMLRLVLILTAICTAVAGMLALVNHFTKDTISENDRKARESAVLSVFPEGDSCREYTVDDGITLYFAVDGDDLVGYCVNVSPSGYGGDVDMMVGFSPDGTVSGIKIVDHSETPGVGTKIQGEAFLSQFIGRGEGVTLSAGENVDVISGATFSSKAVIEGVNDALSLDFDLDEAMAELGLKLSDGSSDPAETDDFNGDNGSETLKPGEAGEVGETEPAETEIAETTAPETSITETEEPETLKPETDIAETEAPETYPVETDAPVVIPPETSWIPELVVPETLPPETEAPETEAPETEAPETAAPETEIVETEAPETEAPETMPPETAAPETEAPETEAPVPEVLLVFDIRTVDVDGNVISDKLDGQINEYQWVSNYYTADYSAPIGGNVLGGWDEVPAGYTVPDSISFVVWPDGDVTCTKDNVSIEIDDKNITFVITLEEDPYATEEYSSAYSIKKGDKE